MKKRNLLLILVLALSLCLGACGEKEPQTIEDAIEQSKEALETLSEQADDRDAQREKLIEKNKIDLGENVTFTGSELAVKIKACSVISWTSLGEEQEQIYLIFDHTNNGTEDTGFNSQGKIDVYQDGVALTGAVYLDDNWMNQIRPGTTIERKEAFVLRNKESDVVVKITELRTNESVEHTIKIK